MDWKAGVQFPAGAGDFLYSAVSRLALGLTQPSTRWTLGALSPELKRLGCENDHLLPSSAVVKKGGAIPPLAHMSSRHSA
jgi:hypothetical protein